MKTRLLSKFSTCNRKNGKSQWHWSVCLLLLLTLSVNSNGQHYAEPTDVLANQLLDRLMISSGLNAEIHPEIKPFSRRDAVRYAVAVDSFGNSISKLDRADLQYLVDDGNEFHHGSTAKETTTSNGFFSNNATGSTGRSLKYSTNAKPVFGIFYKTPANLFEVNAKHFHLKANPILNFNLAQSVDETGILFFNQRGIDVRGDVDGKVYWQTTFQETQARFPDYFNQRITQYKSLPGAGLYKKFKSKLFNSKDSYDFNVANASIGFNATKHIHIQLGHGRNFIGNGYRSLFLSDVGAPTFFLKLNTRVWKFDYQNLFVELSPGSARSVLGNELLPKKYAAMHYLNFNVTPKLSFGFFEATVFHRSEQFEFQYLNPLILYRTVEGLLGSPDNVLIGLDGRWNFANHFQLYGQLIVDEFKSSALYKPAEKGWWANKYGLQAGLKYINVAGIDHLDLQLEVNSVRPYTYSHRDSLNSYTHYLQPLAHPLLSNFNEFIGILRYRPLNRLTLQGKVIGAKIGENNATENWGGDPYISNLVRVKDYGNKVGQGVSANLSIIGFDATWQLYHNVFLDARVMLRRKDSIDNDLDLNTTIFGAGVRINTWTRNQDF